MDGATKIFEENVGEEEFEHDTTAAWLKFVWSWTSFHPNENLSKISISAVYQCELPRLTGSTVFFGCS